MPSAVTHPSEVETNEDSSETCMTKFSPNDGWSGRANIHNSNQ